MCDVSTAPTAHDPRLILLAEPHDDSAAMYTEFLTRYGIAVERVSDGEEALAKVKERHPDLVIAGIMLPRLDGFALCREIKRDARTARIPVIAVTAYSSPKRLEQADAAGFDVFLLKPCAPDDLLRAIRRVMPAEASPALGPRRESQGAP
jgi:two-component system, cell cycle response regulator DivK